MYSQVADLKSGLANQQVELPQTTEALAVLLGKRRALGVKTAMSYRERKRVVAAPTFQIGHD